MTFQNALRVEDKLLPDAPGGIVGNFAAARPLLANTVLAIGLIAMATAGVRQGAPGDSQIIVSFALSALGVIAVPILLAAMQPRQMGRRILFLILIAAAASILFAAATGMIETPPPLSPPQLWQVAAALGWTCYLLALAPITTNAVRFSMVAPFATLLAVIGASGYLSAQSFLQTDLGAAAMAIGLTVGVSAGGSISADFSRYFARGHTHRRAAAAGGHAGVALGAYALMVIAALFGVATFHANFGAVIWRALWAGFTVSALALIASIFATTGVLSLRAPSEQAAVDENRRRQWFSQSWRPVRLILPPATALATTAILGVVVVIGLFEAGFAQALTMALFFVLVWASAAIALMSVRTSLLIVALLAVSAILAGYFFTALGIAVPGLFERLCALTLCAIALGHLTVSWRDASDHLHNARDITEQALNDGLRRFVFIIGAAAVSLFVSAQTLSWTAGVSVIPYMVTTALISLLAAPAMMTAMSARTMRY